MSERRRPTATNLCPVFAIHQIRALAMGAQLQPAIRTEMEAQAAHAALVHEILSALRSALLRRVGNPPRALNHRELKPGTHPHNNAGRHHLDRLAPPEAAHACPAHRRRSPAVQRRHTAAHTRRKSYTGHPQMRRRHGNPGITSSDRKPRRWTSNQRLQTGPKPRRPQAIRPCPGGPPRTTRQRATAQHTPPTPVGWARRRERRGTAWLMQRTHNECGLALAALRPMMMSKNTDATNPPNPNRLFPHPPGGGYAPPTPTIHQCQRRGRGPTRTCPSA